MKTTVRIILAVLLGVFVAGLSGCANVSQKTGFSLQQTNPTGKEQPYLAVASTAIDCKEIKTLFVIMVPLDPSDDEWIGELGVVVSDEKKLVQNIYRRDAWRGWVKINGNINKTPYPALIDDVARYLWILVPNVTKGDLSGAQATILSGASTRAMVPSGKILNLPKGKQEDSQLVEDLFKKNSAKVGNNQVVDFSPGTKMGDIFIADISRRFPVLLRIGGQKLMATKDVVETASMTAQDSMVDKVISRGHVSASLMSVLAYSHPIPAVIQTTQIFYGLTMAATDKEMYGPYGETKYPGWAVGRVLGYYLKQNHRLINHQEELLSGR